MMKKLGATAIGLIVLAGCAAPSNHSASAFMREQQEKEAQINRAEAEQAQERYQDQPAMMISLIEENLMQRRYFAANAYVNAYLQQHGPDPTVNLLQATTLRHLDHLAEAQAIYEQALTGPKKAEALHGLGLIAAKQSKMQLAIQLLEQSAKLDPVNPQLLSDLGYALLVTGQTVQARMPLGQAIELAPDNKRIVANAALLLILEQQPQRATELMTASQMGAAEQAEVYGLAAHFRSPTSRPAPEPAPVPVSTPLLAEIRSEETVTTAASYEEAPVPQTENVNIAPSIRIQETPIYEEEVAEVFAPEPLEPEPLTAEPESEQTVAPATHQRVIKIPLH